MSLNHADFYLYLADGDAAMLKGTYDYVDDDFLMSKAIKIPLTGNEMSLVIVAPNKASDMDFVQKRLGGDNLAVLLKRSMKRTKLQVEVRTSVVLLLYLLPGPMYYIQCSFFLSSRFQFWI